MGSLVVGVAFARAYGAALGIPVVGVNHIEAHLHAATLEHGESPLPSVALVVSGGHTELVEVRGFGRYRWLGSTRDDAAGEAYDKVAKLLGLGFPGGPVIDALAATGDRAAFAFPRPMLDRPDLDFSFSGLKTAVALAVARLGPPPLAGSLPADLAASFQAAVMDTLVGKTLRAADLVGARAVTVGGGVSANRELARAPGGGLPGARHPVAGALAAALRRQRRHDRPRGLLDARAGRRGRGGPRRGGLARGVRPADGRGLTPDAGPAGASPPSPESCSPAPHLPIPAGTRPRRRAAPQQTDDPGTDPRARGPARGRPGQPRVVRGVHAAGSHDRARPRRALGRSAALTKSRILIAEDEPNIREVLHMQLELNGFEVVEACDGIEAVELAERVRPDVMLLDVMMPRMDGYEALQRLRALVRDALHPDHHAHRQEHARGHAAGLPGRGQRLHHQALRHAPSCCCGSTTSSSWSRQQREANPLTGLPGNLSINRGDRSAGSAPAQPFALLQVDIDFFKAYNDHYGYARGDEAIQTLSRILVEAASHHGEGHFVGHIGGDDFVLLSTPGHAEAIGQEIIDAFNAAVPALYDAEDRERGYVEVIEPAARARATSRS